MHEWEWLFLPRSKGETEELYRSVSAFRQGSYKSVAGAGDGRKTDREANSFVAGFEQGVI